MFPRVERVTFYFSSIFSKKVISVNSYLSILIFKVTVISNSHQFATIFMMEQSESRKKQSSITFPPVKTGTAQVNEEKKKVSPVNSSSNAEPGYLKKSQNADLINSISTLINKRLTEFRSEMITKINKNGDQPVSLRDRDS